MSIERVKAYFKQYDMEERIREFDVSSATVELAAAALACEPQRIAKTLSFLQGDKAALVCTAGDAKVDNHKYTERFGMSAIERTIPELKKYSGYAEWVDVCKGY